MALPLPADDMWRRALLSVGLVSAIPLICLVFVARGHWARAMSRHLMSLATGALLASAAFELIPEAVQHVASGWIVAGYVAVGFLAFAALERLIRFHVAEPAPLAAAGVRPYVILNMIGVMLHNAIDGMIIAASFMAGTGVGIAATIAIVLHEVPHELGNFGVFVHGGVSPVRAVLLNVLLAGAAIAGTVVTLAIGSRTTSFAASLIPVAAGNFVYVAAIDLVPELYRELAPARRWPEVAIIFAGALLSIMPALLVR